MSSKCQSESDVQKKTNLGLRKNKRRSIENEICIINHNVYVGNAIYLFIFGTCNISVEKAHQVQGRKFANKAVPTAA